MLNPEELAFAQQMVEAAHDSSHIWPGYSAAEACLESAWGASQLAIRAKNVFGLKLPSDWTGGILQMPTTEFINGVWEHGVPASWPIFGSYPDAFNERMDILRTRSLYAAAIHADNGEDFVKLVSQHWSTDPQRAAKVLSTYSEHVDIFGGDNA